MRAVSISFHLVVCLALASLVAAGCGGDERGELAVDATPNTGNGDPDAGEADSGSGEPAESRFTYASEVVIPSIEEGGEPACCKDFGELSEPKIERDEDVLDNAFAQLASAIAEYDDAVEADLDMQGIIDEQLADGRLVVLYEHIDLRSESDAFTLEGFLGAFAGETSYESASSGEGSFTIDPVSYGEDGDAIIRFDDAALESGQLETAPTTIGFASPIGNELLQLNLHDAEVMGSAALSEGGVSYAEGDAGVAGYLLLDELFEALNAFLNSEECACLDRPEGADDVYVKQDGSWSGANCVSEHSCETDNPCATMAESGLISMCSLLPGILEENADIRTDPESSDYQGLSVGFEFTGVPADVSE